MRFRDSRICCTRTPERVIKLTVAYMHLGRFKSLICISSKGNIYTANGVQTGVFQYCGVKRDLAIL